MARVVKSEAEWRAELDPEAVPRPAREGHRGAVHGRVRPRLRAGHLPLRRLRRRALHLRGEVRLGLRLAGVLRAGERRGDRRGDRHELRHGAHRGDVRRVRRPPGARVPRRAAPDRRALLHQLGLARSSRRSEPRQSAGPPGAAGRALRQPLSAWQFFAAQVSMCCSAWRELRVAGTSATSFMQLRERRRVGCLPAAEVDALQCVGDLRERVGERLEVRPDVGGCLVARTPSGAAASFWSRRSRR